MKTAAFNLDETKKTGSQHITLSGLHLNQKLIKVLKWSDNFLSKFFVEPSRIQLSSIWKRILVSTTELGGQRPHLGGLFFFFSQMFQRSLISGAVPLYEYRVPSFTSLSLNSHDRNRLTWDVRVKCRRMCKCIYIQAGHDHFFMSRK